MDGVRVTVNIHRKERKEEQHVLGCFSHRKKEGKEKEVAFVAFVFVIWEKKQEYGEGSENCDKWVR